MSANWHGCADDIKLVAASDLFDAEWYLRRYPDVAEVPVRPEEHYVLLGGPLLRFPSKHFDPMGYLEVNPDAKGQNPLVHFLKFGNGTPLSIFPNRLRTGFGDVNSDTVTGDEDTPLTHIPDRMTRRVRAQKSLAWPKSASPVYRTVRAHMDYLNYITKHYDLAQSKPSFDLAKHYVNSEEKENRSPVPYFSARSYRKRYAKQLEGQSNLFYHWVTEGRKKGMVAHPMAGFEEVADILGMTPETCQEEIIAYQENLRERLSNGILGDMVRRAEQCDPLVGRTWRGAMAPNIQPFHQDSLSKRLVAISRLQKAVGYQRAKAVVCVNRPRWGSNRRLEGHVTHALADLYGPENVLFLTLDNPGEVPTHKYPAGVRCVDGASLLQPLSEPEKQRVALEFLRSLRPKAVFNVNAALLWGIQSSFETIVKHDLPVVGCFFCNDKSIYGTWGGYPSVQFYRQFPNMKAVCTDSHFLRDSLIEQFFVSKVQQRRLHVLEAPVDGSLTQVSAQPPGNERPQVFWAGRLDHQKRPDVLFEIAKNMPSADFRVWGETVASGPDLQKNWPENVTFLGSYTSFEELPLNEADAWLYTSEWDGVPSMLLEVAMTGLPIVGSLVGGTGEVLHDDLSWPIAPFDDATRYVTALQEVFAEPVKARENAKKLRERIVEQRTEERYKQQVLAVMETVQS